MRCPGKNIDATDRTIFQYTNDFPRYYLKAVLIFNKSELRGPAHEQILNQNI